MKAKLLNAMLIVASLFGYLEWGTDQHVFLFQIEGELIGKLFTNPGSVLHPFVILPLFGQAVLLVTLFQKVPGKRLSLTGISCIGILLLFLFVIGCIGMNWKILLCSLPFLVLGVYGVRYYFKRSSDGHPSH